MLQWLRQPVIFVALLLFAFGVFVWPTPWQTTHTSGLAFARVNRFTGTAELLHAMSAPPGRCLVGPTSDWFELYVVGMGFFVGFPLAGLWVFRGARHAVRALRQRQK
jgi:hypothetical protein